jgi:hypothetical protein
LSEVFTVKNRDFSKRIFSILASCIIFSGANIYAQGLFTGKSSGFGVSGSFLTNNSGPITEEDFAFTINGDVDLGLGFFQGGRDYESSGYAPYITVYMHKDNDKSPIFFSLTPSYAHSYNYWAFGLSIDLFAKLPVSSSAQFYPSIGITVAHTYPESGNESSNIGYHLSFNLGFKVHKIVTIAFAPGISTVKESDVSYTKFNSSAGITLGIIVTPF